MTLVKNTDWSDTNIIRAGIIPYIDVGHTRFYGLGIASDVGDLCDFGGHKELIDKDLLDTAIREYEEESFNLFGKLTREMLMNCLVLKGIDTYEILLPVYGNLYNYTLTFQKLVGNNKKHEIQNFIWLTYNQLTLTNVYINGVNILLIYNKICHALNIPLTDDVDQSNDYCLYIRTKILVVFVLL